MFKSISQITASISGKYLKKVKAKISVVSHQLKMDKAFSFILMETCTLVLGNSSYSMVKEFTSSQQVKSTMEFSKIH